MLHHCVSSTSLDIDGNVVSPYRELSWHSHMTAKVPSLGNSYWIQQKLQHQQTCLWWCYTVLKTVNIVNSISDQVKWDSPDIWLCDTDNYDQQLQYVLSWNIEHKCWSHTGKKSCFTHSVDVTQFVVIKLYLYTNKLTANAQFTGVNKIGTHI